LFLLVKQSFNRPKKVFFYTAFKTESLKRLGNSAWLECQTHKKKTKNKKSKKRKKTKKNEKKQEKKKNKKSKLEAFTRRQRLGNLEVEGSNPSLGILNT